MRIQWLKKKKKSSSARRRLALLLPLSSHPFFFILFSFIHIYYLKKTQNWNLSDPGVCSLGPFSTFSQLSYFRESWVSFSFFSIELWETFTNIIIFFYVKIIRCEKSIRAKVAKVVSISMKTKRKFLGLRTWWSVAVLGIRTVP